MLIKAALNCNQELIVKLLGVIRASHAYTALGYSAACNNTLCPCFYFSNLGSDYFYYKSKQSELLVEEADSLLAAQWGHGPVSLPCMLSLPRKVVKTQENAALTIQANLVLQHLWGYPWMFITKKYTDVWYMIFWWWCMIYDVWWCMMMMRTTKNLICTNWTETCKCAVGFVLHVTVNWNNSFHFYPVISALGLVGWSLSQHSDVSATCDITGFELGFRMLSMAPRHEKSKPGSFVDTVN